MHELQRKKKSFVRHTFFIRVVPIQITDEADQIMTIKDFTIFFFIAVLQIFALTLIFIAVKYIFDALLIFLTICFCWKR